MPAAYFIGSVIAASVLTALLVALVVRRSMTIAAARLRETGVEPLRAANVELERRLLLEEQKAARVAELEPALAERVREVRSLGEAKAAAEGQLATAAEALRRVEAAHRETRERLEGSEASLAEARREAGDLRSSLARIQETLNQERRQAEEKLALMTEAKAEMVREFKLMAQQIIEQQNDDFGRQSREQIENLLNPLADRLTEFESGLRAAHQESTEGRAALTEQIRQLTHTSERMTAETNSLVRALHGETQGQGAWGEMILSLLLERSGLREGEEYVIEGSDGAGEERGRSPDAVVNLPGGQHILIDAKVPLVAFEAYLGAVTEDDRAAQLSRHLVSLRRHIRALNTGEGRPVSASALDYVVMFVPVEGALALALQHDASLTGYAAEHHVAIATPTTLMMALRTAANVWQVERRNRNAEAIAERAGRIYDKFVEFLEDMDNVGHRLEQARTSYDRARDKLSAGKGNLVRQVKRLGKLAPERTKRLPRDSSGLTAE
jgi:DNA recombination protein RmuC